MNCEDFLIQKLALLDGEKTDLSAEAIDAHFAVCEDCRREIESLAGVGLMLQRQKRSTPHADLWAAVEKQIAAQPKAAFTLGWQPFALAGALFAALKLIEMLPERDLGWILKLAPFVIGVVLFGALKENPFKINTALVPEK